MKKTIALVLTLVMMMSLTAAMGSELTYEGTPITFTGGFSITFPSTWNVNTLTEEDAAAGVILWVESEDGAISYMVNQYAAEEYTLADMLAQMESNELVSECMIATINDMEMLCYTLTAEDDLSTNGVVLYGIDSCFYEVIIQYVGEDQVALAQEILSTIAACEIAE